MVWWAFVIGVGLCVVPSVAVAAPYPAVLYVPTEDVDLEPSGNPGGPCEDVSLSDYHSVFGCVPNLDAAETFAIDTDAANIVDAIEAELDAYDVFVTTEPPPAYLPANAVLLGADAQLESNSWSCSAAVIACGSRRRNGIGFAYPETANCVAADLSQVGLYAFGRLTGLEGKTNAGDHMLYPGDFSGTPRNWVDQCDPISNQLNDEGVPLPNECLNSDHESCDADEANSHADLLDYYGARVTDTDPPELTNGSPTDGQNFPGDPADVTLGVEIADADPIVGVQFTIESPVFEPVFGGPLTVCTNNHCDIDLLENDPFKPTDSEWAVELTGLPAGEYTVTIEASDYHGNVADPIVATFTVGGPSETTGTTGTETTGGPEPSTTTGDNIPPPPITSGSPTPDPPDDPLPEDDDSGDATGGGSDDGGIVDRTGCGCRTAGPTPVLLLFLLGFMRLKTVAT